MGVRFLITKIVSFACVFAVLQVAWQLSAGTATARSFIEVTTVRPAAFIANRLTPDFHVEAVGTRLLAPAGGINIVNGCDGMETLFLLVAGFAIAPLSWRLRLLGSLIGVPIVYVLNQSRILALFYAHIADAQLFDLLHGIIAPVIMVLIIAAYYY